MIKLTDLISMAGISLDNYKIHCATGQQHPPLEAFFSGTFKEWQELQTKENFRCKNILSLIHMEKEKWLFAGVYSVIKVSKTKDKKNPYYNPSSSYFNYKTKELSGLNHLTGKVIVAFDKKFRASYLVGKNFGDSLLVHEMRADRMTIGEFPNYNAVVISHDKLRIVINELNPSWKSALSNVSGVYLITDTSDGRLYVGSAYGDQGLWKRWSDYASNGHGGNKELKELLKSKGKKHSRFFQFSILETCDLNTDSETVIERENHWKTVLTSREHGLNSN